MSYKNTKPDKSYLLAELTPEQKSTKACWFHRWEYLDNVWAYHRYFQCKKCFDRKVCETYGGGYSPINNDWLDGKAWNHHGMNPPMARTKTPVSATPTATPRLDRLPHE